MKVSLLLPSFKRPDLLDLGLWSISQQLISHELEIIVLNDGIKDNTENICKKYRKKLKIKYIFTGQRNKEEMIWRISGFAINIGVKRATGDIIILSCAEMFHLNNSIDLAVNALIENENYIVTPEYILFDDNRKVLNYLTVEKTLDLPKEIKPDVTPTALRQTAMPYFMAFYKKHFITIGGYDEDLTGYAADDNDLTDRLMTLGLIYYYVPSQIIHLYHSGTCDASRHDERPDWTHNFNIYKNRNKLIKRNLNREWGENK